MSNILIVLLFAIIIGTVVLRYLFKGSIFLRIGIIWVINVFLVVVNSKIHYANPESYPFSAALATGLILTTLMLYGVSKWVRKPLDYLIDNIKQLSKGDLSNIKSDSKQKKYKGELKTLNTNITTLINIFRESILEINQSASRVSNLGDTTNGIAKELSSTNTEQASSIEEISASMEEMNANIDSSYNNANKTKKQTELTNNNLRDSNQSALELLQAMHLIAEKIKVIDQIATQTNLLALNASIEAKQAGEAGKGFNVVAGAVRQLAENSKKAADEIQEITEKGKLLSEVVSQKLEQTIPNMAETVNLMSEISVSSKELKTGSDQITQALNGINNITQSNTKVAEELTNHSGKLSNQSHKLLKNIGFFKL
ncbi:hypothetical protein E9993_19350 [Labilibacter sediminis]|nr:hypothetical protein E9993_19350 [Labilibacter sediminis]